MEDRQLAKFHLFHAYNSQKLNNNVALADSTVQIVSVAETFRIFPAKRACVLPIECKFLTILVVLRALYIYTAKPVKLFNGKQNVSLTGSLIRSDQKHVHFGKIFRVQVNSRRQKIRGVRDDEHFSRIHVVTCIVGFKINKYKKVIFCMCKKNNANTAKELVFVQISSLFKWESNSQI